MIATVCGGFAAASADDSSATAHFEKSIRPLLIARCIDCHGPDSQDGGLRLDTRAGWVKGGDTGTPIIVGKPASSLLMRAVGYQDIALQMPPDGRLKPSEIAALRKWIADGAIDPRVDDSETVETVQTADELLDTFWAYQPVSEPVPPEVASDENVRQAVDRFVLARLEAKGRQFNAEADAHTLVRRIYFDLTGLPPSPDELDHWAPLVSDPAQWKRLVDELLDSRRFAEHFARRWLDVVRYSESVTLRGFILNGAWRYRDSVVEAFDSDRPYDQFVRDHLAGDLIADETESLGERRQRMAAATFLLLGNTNFEEQNKRQLEMDIVDEQLSVMGTAFLGQTIGCARCHDHKFDPISTREYYSLAGILHNALPMKHGNISVWEPSDYPLDEQTQAEFASVRNRLDSAKKELKAARDRLAALSDDPEIIAANSLPGIVVDDSDGNTGIVGEWKHSRYSKRYIGVGYRQDDNEGQGTKTITFTPDLPGPGEYEVRFAYIPGGGRATNVPVTLLHAAGETTIRVDQSKVPDIDQRFVSLGTFRFEDGNQGYVTVANEGANGFVTADAVQYLPINSDQTEVEMDVDRTAEQATAKAAVDAAQEKVNQLDARWSERPQMLLPREKSKIKDLPVHVRGSVHLKGEIVPRDVPRIGGPIDVSAATDEESGRRELAYWLSSPDNRLTSRVMVNRLWLWVFGEGIVRSPNNFGSTGRLPTHPELLDHLANLFVEQGWSTKSIVRELVLSQAYRQASAAPASLTETDPDNRLWGRAERKRLPAESIRDAMLAATGELDFVDSRPTPDVKSDYGYEFKANVRSMYLPVFRNEVPDLFAAFDFPDPSMSIGRRDESVIAPQALYLMNSPFVIKRAERLAELITTQDAAGESAERQLNLLYRRLLSREPTAAEQELSLQVLNQAAGEDEVKRTWGLIAHALLASPDFRYLD
ncbi:DUF1553 domain-containing protein [Stratiformator vulcanicus]|nr:DUF1553 domain-containing protein [Stratiformator vulcanicus]